MQNALLVLILISCGLLMIPATGCQPRTGAVRQSARPADSSIAVKPAPATPDTSALQPSGHPRIALPSPKAARALNAYLATLSPEPQLFVVDADSPSTVRGEGGTILCIQPTDLALPDGSAPKEAVVVSLQELAGQQDIALAGAQTLAGDQLLESAGAYHIQMSSGGQPLSLREGKSLQALFPKPRSSKAGMQLFYGKRDARGSMNWTAAGQPLDKNDRAGRPTMSVDRANQRDSADGPVLSYGIVTDGSRAWLGWSGSCRGDTLTRAQATAVQEIQAGVYEALSVSKLGWINCDRFYNTRPEDQTQLACSLEEGSYAEETPVRIFLVFKGINSVLDRWYIPTQDNRQGTFGNIPRGEAVRLVAVSKGKDGLRAAQYDLTTGEATNQVIALQPATDQALKQMFAVR